MRKLVTIYHDDSVGLLTIKRNGLGAEMFRGTEWEKDVKGVNLTALRKCLKECKNSAFTWGTVSFPSENQNSVTVTLGSKNKKFWVHRFAFLLAVTTKVRWIRSSWAIVIGVLAGIVLIFSFLQETPSQLTVAVSFPILIASLVVALANLPTDEL